MSYHVDKLLCPISRDGEKSENSVP